MNLKPLVVMAAVVATLALAACSDEGSGDGPGWTKISPAELVERMRADDVVLVNVHVPYEGELPGTDAFIPYTELASRIDELPRDPATLVIYCRSGSMSTQAAQELVDAGVTGFAELEGGYLAWQAAGLPVVTEDAAG